MSLPKLCFFKFAANKALNLLVKSDFSLGCLLLKFLFLDAAVVGLVYYFEEVY